MTNLSETILVESRAARDGLTNEMTHDKAENALRKAKALFYFVMHQGNKIATTEQVAEFYEIPTETVRKAYGRHKDEFACDGVREIKGNELKALPCLGSDKLSLPNSVTRLLTWTPRGTARLGMLLRDSEVGKAVRTALLDEANASAEKDTELEKLRMQVAISQANAATTSNQVKLVEKTETLASLHGVSMALILLGRSDEVVEVEKPVIEVIDDKHKAYFKGQTLKQITEYVRKRYGIRLKDGGVVKKLLKAANKDSLIAHVPRAVVGEYVPQEHLAEVYKILTEGNHQMMLGE